MYFYMKQRIKAISINSCCGLCLIISKHNIMNMFSPCHNSETVTDIYYGSYLLFSVQLVIVQWLVTVVFTFSFIINFICIAMYVEISLS